MTANTLNVSTAPPPPTTTGAVIEDIFDYPTNLVYITLTCLIMTFGVLVNLALARVYYKGDIQRSHFHFCLMHLGVANIGQQIGFVPWMVVDLKATYSADPLLDTVICGFTDGLSGFFLAAFVNVWSILHMSVVRYQIIKHPMMANMRIATKRRSRLAFILFWVFSALLIVPNLLTFENTRVYGFCVRTHRYTREFTGVYRSLLSLAGLVVPIIIIVVVYILIFRQFFHKGSNNAREEGGNQGASQGGANRFVSQVKRKNRNRVVRFLGVLALTFVCSWVPFGVYFILNTVGYFATGTASEYRKTRIMKWTMLPCLSTGITNVLSYTVMYPQFRKEFWRRRRHTRRTTVKSTYLSTTSTISRQMPSRETSQVSVDTATTKSRRSSSYVEESKN